MADPTGKSSALLALDGLEIQAETLKGLAAMPALPSMALSEEALAAMKGPAYTKGLADALSKVSLSEEALATLKAPAYTKGLADALSKVSLSEEALATLKAPALTKGLADALSKVSLSEEALATLKAPALTKGLADALSKVSLSEEALATLKAPALTKGLADALSKVSLSEEALATLKNPAPRPLIEAMAQLNAQAFDVLSPTFRENFFAINDSAFAPLSNAIGPFAEEIRRNAQTAKLNIQPERALFESLERSLNEYASNASPGFLTERLVDVADELDDLGILEKLDSDSLVGDDVSVAEALRGLAVSNALTPAVALRHMGATAVLIGIIHPALQECMPPSSYPGELFILALGLSVSLVWLWCIAFGSPGQGD